METLTGSETRAWIRDHTHTPPHPLSLLQVPAPLTLSCLLSQGYHGEEKAFIATQGPMVNTVNDFWQMAWQEEAPAIVMITKLKEKNEVGAAPPRGDTESRGGRSTVLCLSAEVCPLLAGEEGHLREGGGSGLWGQGM